MQPKQYTITKDKSLVITGTKHKSLDVGIFSKKNKCIYHIQLTICNPWFIPCFKHIPNKNSILFGWLFFYFGVIRLDK